MHLNSLTIYEDEAPQLADMVVGNAGRAAQQRALDALRVMGIKVIIRHDQITGVILPGFMAERVKLLPCDHYTFEEWWTSVAKWKAMLEHFTQELGPAIIDCHEALEINLPGYERIQWTCLKRFGLITRYVKLDSVKKHRQGRKELAKLAKLLKYY